MAAAAIAVAWSEESPTDEDAEAGATRLRRDLHAICNSCMPRSGAVPARCTGGPRGALVSARRASVLGADTPDLAIGGGKTKPR